MSAILKELSVSSIVSALEANAVERYRAWAAWPEFQFHEDSQMVWTMSPVASYFFNSVLRTQVAPSQTERCIEVMMERAGSRKVPMMWWVGPSTEPAGLGASLEAKGFTRLAQMPGMAMDLSALNENFPSPNGFLIEPVRDLDMLKSWADVVAVTSGFPDLVKESWLKIHAAIGVGSQQPLLHYLARRDGIPVSAASVLLGSGVAYLCSVMVVPEARRQGIGSAISLHALREARRRGVRIGTLWSSEMGEDSYRRIGFRKYCKGDAYVWPGK